MQPHTLVIFALLFSFSLPSHAEWRERRAALSEMHAVAEFRIFYSRTGADALPNAEDANNNGVPDYVDRVARQLLAARGKYADQFGLRHPFASPRYRNMAQFIDVNLLSYPLKPNGPKYGIAYDELSSFARRQDAGRKVRVLLIDIANNLPDNRATVAHELFHLYQYGYTFFKNRWYLEGTARWAERPFKKIPDGPWPRSAPEIRELFQQTYETGRFWRRLVGKMDRDFVRAFLQELDRMDDTLSSDGKWAEAEQRSSANDIHIWHALRQTLNRPEYLTRWDEEVRSLMAIELR